MNKGPMSRLAKVPVKCKTCGKMKYNVVCRNQLTEEKIKEVNKEAKEEKKISESTPSKPVEKKYKKPREYGYINAVVNKQSKMAERAYRKDTD